MFDDPSIITALREMAKEGRTIVDMVNKVRELTGCDASNYAFPVAFFHTAFGTGLADMKDIWLWSGFAGNLTDQEINALLMPLINKNRAQWDSESNQ
jgi:hypothetical protein